MKLTEAQIRDIWTRRTARGKTRQAECLTAEQFERACAGEMNKHDRAQIANHMITCSDCADEYRILRSLRPLVDAIEALHDHPAVARFPVYGSNTFTADKSVTLWRRFAAYVSPARAIAASAALLLITLALGLWILSIRRGNERQIAQLNRELAERDMALVSARESLDNARRQLEETTHQAELEKSLGDSKRYEDEIAQLRQTITDLSRPQIDVPIIDLDPSSPTRGNSTDGAARIDIPPTANFFTLILNITGQRSPSTYAVEIYDSNSKQVWRGQRLRNSRENSVNLTLARKMFPAGRYLIKLYAPRNRNQEPVAAYPVVIGYR